MLEQSNIYCIASYFKVNVNFFDKQLCHILHVHVTIVTSASLEKDETCNAVGVLLLN